MSGLGLATARAIVDAALARGRETGCQPLTVTVLDAGGHLKACAREDGAGILRPRIAEGKAWGALGLGLGTRAMAARVEQGPRDEAFFAALAAASGGRVVPVPGGVLVRDGAGAILGAVGITGDTSDRDEACAVAAIEAAGLVPDPG